jgi:hypothetical protein
MREIRMSGLMSGEGKRTAMRYRASPRLYLPGVRLAAPFGRVRNMRFGLLSGGRPPNDMTTDCDLERHPPVEYRGKKMYRGV